MERYILKIFFFHNGTPFYFDCNEKEKDNFIILTLIADLYLCDENVKQTKFFVPQIGQSIAKETQYSDNNQAKHEKVAELENEIYLHYYTSDFPLYLRYHCCCYKGRCVEVGNWYNLSYLLHYL